MSKPDPNLASVMSLLSQKGFTQGATLASSLNKEIYQQSKIDPTIKAAIEKMRTDPNPNNMTDRQLKTECNELYDYARETPEILEKIYRIITRLNFFPVELNDPDSGTIDNPWLGRGFAIFFTRGSVTLDELLYESLRINIKDFDNWKDALTVGRNGEQNGKTNERNFFESIYIGLKFPFVRRGGKRSTKRKNNKFRRTSKKSKSKK